MLRNILTNPRFYSTFKQDLKIVVSKTGTLTPPVKKIFHEIENKIDSLSIENDKTEIPLHFSHSPENVVEAGESISLNSGSEFAVSEMTTGDGWVRTGYSLFLRRPQSSNATEINCEIPYRRAK